MAKPERLRVTVSDIENVVDNVRAPDTERVAVLTLDGGIVARADGDLVSVNDTVPLTEMVREAVLQTLLVAHTDGKVRVTVTVPLTEEERHLVGDMVGLFVLVRDTVGVSVPEALAEGKNEAVGTRRRACRMRALWSLAESPVSSSRRRLAPPADFWDV